MTTPAAIDAATQASQNSPFLMIEKGFDEFPKPKDKKFEYGTTGIRTKGDILESTCYRLAIIGAIRSKSLGGKLIGLMVTASHNPEPDNGIKPIDSRGEMLDVSWEPYCTNACNAENFQEFIAIIKQLIQNFKIDMNVQAKVIYAHDTRPTSSLLCKAIASGLAAMYAEIIDAGLKTTPQLHYLVHSHNTLRTSEAYGEPTEEGYYKKLAEAFLLLVKGKPPVSKLTIDCANGVGAHALLNLQKYIPKEALEIRPLRTAIGQPGALNDGCGADFVKIQQRLPKDLEKEGIKQGDRLCSFDGDADRIVYYYLRGQLTNKDSFRLLDGDKIAALATDFIQELVKKASIDINVGCVQTAYANGSSTKYLKQRVPVTCTPTGVKHLHKAAEQYDVGVYFEANGHGTILFSPHAQRIIAESSPDSPAAEEAITQLRNLINVINQTVGDAISDMLLVECILRSRQWDCQEWDGLYEELPNKMLKVIVKDRSSFTTEDAERRLVTPKGAQSKIDEIVAKYKDARAFVRPSGTEDCVRVYAETSLSGELNSLANNIAKVVQDVDQ